MNLSEIEALADLCLKRGIRRAKVDGVELEFGPAPAPEMTEKQMRKIAEALGGEPTPEDVLYHSAPQVVVREPDGEA